jgi:hypothetical protein
MAGEQDGKDVLNLFLWVTVLAYLSFACLVVLAAGMLVKIVTKIAGGG